MVTCNFFQVGKSLAFLDLKISLKGLDRGLGTTQKQKRQLPEAVPAHEEGSSRAATALAALLHFRWKDSHGVSDGIRTRGLLGHNQVP